MPAKLTLTLDGIPRLQRKLDKDLVEPPTGDAVKDVADETVPIMRTIIPQRTGTGAGSVYATRYRERTGNVGAAFVGGIDYLIFPDRGTVHITNPRWWSRTGATRVSSFADRRLHDEAGKEIAREWSK